ncbi:hypothetical protein [Pendulispora albinea]|uniref:Uncharacterized protein n=1 Tax=Pendulispora albinea TaxID=2741071 RepID=A0ABZ2LUL2_9BACT
MKRVFATLFLAGLCATACNDDFSQGWRIDKTRVLGARAVVDADPTRSSPAAGESFHVDWFVVSPGGPLTTNWRLTACRRADVLRGVQCEGPSLTEVSGTSNAPSIGLTAPQSDTGYLLVSGDIDKTNVEYSVMLQTEKNGTNRNPRIESTDVRLRDITLTAEDGACDSLPQFLADGAKFNLELTVHDRDREPIEGGRETMTLSHFTTAGKLERLYSALDGAAAAGDGVLSVPWEIKRDINPPAAGLVVRFYFGLRDSRAGMDFATRAICVKPAPT